MLRRCLRRSLHQAFSRWSTLTRRRRRALSMIIPRRSSASIFSIWRRWAGRSRWVKSMLSVWTRRSKNHTLAVAFRAIRDHSTLVRRRYKTMRRRRLLCRSFFAWLDHVNECIHERRNSWKSGVYQTPISFAPSMSGSFLRSTPSKGNRRAPSPVRATRPTGNASVTSSHPSTPTKQQRTYSPAVKRPASPVRRTSNVPEEEKWELVRKLDIVNNKSFRLVAQLHQETTAREQLEKQVEELQQLYSQTQQFLLEEQELHHISQRDLNHCREELASTTTSLQHALEQQGGTHEELQEMYSVANAQREQVTRLKHKLVVNNRLLVGGVPSRAAILTQALEVADAVQLMKSLCAWRFTMVARNVVQSRLFHQRFRVMGPVLGAWRRWTRRQRQNAVVLQRFLRQNTIRHQRCIIRTWAQTASKLSQERLLTEGPPGWQICWSSRQRRRRCLHRTWSTWRALVLRSRRFAAASTALTRRCGNRVLQHYFGEWRRWLLSTRRPLPRLARVFAAARAKQWLRRHLVAWHELSHRSLLQRVAAYRITTRRLRRYFLAWAGRPAPIDSPQKSSPRQTEEEFELTRRLQIESDKTFRLMERAEASDQDRVRAVHERDIAVREREELIRVVDPLHAQLAALQQELSRCRNENEALVRTVESQEFEINQQRTAMRSKDMQLEDLQALTKQHQLQVQYLDGELTSTTEKLAEAKVKISSLDYEVKAARDFALGSFGSQ